VNVRIALPGYDKDATGRSVVAYSGGLGRKHAQVSLGAWAGLSLGEVTLMGGEALDTDIREVLAGTPRIEGTSSYEEDHGPTTKALTDLFWAAVASDPKIARKVAKLAYKQGWREGRSSIRRKFHKLMKVNW
jgi:hypothetical protein